MFSQPPRGLIVGLVTPLDAKGRPDGRALAGLMERVRDEAAGFLAGGLRHGEGLHLDLSARLEVLEAALEGAGRRAVVFEITGREADETRDLLIRAEKIVDRVRPEGPVFHLVHPIVYHSNRDLPGHLGELAAASPRRLIVGNDPDLVALARPGPHHKNIRTSVLKKIGAVEPFAGLIFSGDMTRAINYQRALKKRRDVRFYDGDEANFLDRPSSSGLVSIGALVLPTPWADVVASSLNIFDAQRMYPDHISQIWKSGQAVRALYEACAAKPVGLIKHALYKIGAIPNDRLADEAQKPDKAETEKIMDLLNELNLR